VVEPFDFTQSLKFLQGFGPMSGEQQLEEGRVTKAVMVEGQTVVLRVGRKAGKESGLGYELFSHEPLRPVEDFVVKRMSFFLSLSDEVGRFYSIAEEDAKFYPLVERSWGLHQVKFPTLMEIACWAIVVQRVQRPIAIRMKRAITERFGGSLELGGRTYWAFPDYLRLKDATPRQLLEATKSQRAAKRLASLLSYFGELDEAFLRSAPYDKATARLQKVDGIGDWSSQFILFRGLGRIEALQPINLRPLSEVIEKVYGQGGKSLDEINSTYGRWCGYWSLYLWASTMGQA
jgi:DNA-3-methyladenine glycosylase II